MRRQKLIVYALMGGVGVRFLREKPLQTYCQTSIETWRRFNDALELLDSKKS